MSKSFIIDRRLNNKNKSIVNRSKLLKRIEGQIKKSIPDILNKQPIKDINQGKGQITIPIKGIGEPTFNYDKSKGTKHYVLPGNSEPDPTTAYIEGDKIGKPQGGGGKGRGKKGSNDPSVGEDDFVINISKDEFLKYFFDDLELPDLTKKYLSSVEEVKWKRSGYQTEGSPSNLNIVKSYKNSLGRRIAMQVSIEENLKRLESELKAFKKIKPIDKDKEEKLEAEIEFIKKQLITIPFLDDKDLSYNHFEKKKEPTTNAVMFCIMDVSGSMGEREKDIARRFFTLLYIFLTKQYPTIEIVFIQHHTEAKEVTEEEFFNSKENGGTIIVSALQMMKKIIDERYNENWNIYVSQASDGDVWDGSDAAASSRLMSEMMPKIQYTAYLEIGNDYNLEASSGDMSQLWSAYRLVANAHKNFQMKYIKDVSEIWKVFQQLFEKSH